MIPVDHALHQEPLEGQDAFDGSEGRVELLVEESTWTRPRVRVTGSSQVLHGGGDVRMPADLFGERAPDALGRAAGAVDGARSLVTGPAVNRSPETGMPVAARELGDV
ncbi:hypothetical protein [Streptomyces sp. NPDC002324]